MKSTRFSLTKALSGSAFVKILSMGLGFLLTLVLARTLSPAGYGFYSFALALITLLAIPAQMGVPEVVVRETAKYHAAENWKALKGLWRWSLFAVLIASMIAILIGSMGYLLYELGRSSLSADVFLSGIFLLPFMAFASLRGAMLSGLRRVVIGQLPDAVLRPVVLIMLILLGAASGVRVEPDTVMFYHIIAALIVFLIGTYLLIRFSPKEVTQPLIVETDIGGWTKSAFSLALISGMYIVNQQLDILFLGWLSTAEEVGIYKVISQMGMLVIFGQQMVRGVISPEISRYWTQKELERLEHLARLSGMVSFTIALIVSIAFLLGGRLLLEILFGAEYAVGFLAMIILCLGQLINASFGSLGNILSMTGNANASLWALSASIIINCLLNALLIPLWGLEGAACATTISIVFWNIMLWRVVRKKVKIRPTIFKI
ncbi:MAG: flippase [Cellvibrio sp.]